MMELKQKNKLTNVSVSSFVEGVAIHLKFCFHMHKQNRCKSDSDLTYVVGLLTGVVQLKTEFWEEEKW